MRCRRGFQDSAAACGSCCAATQLRTRHISIIYTQGCKWEHPAHSSLSRASAPMRRRRRGPATRSSRQAVPVSPEIELSQRRACAHRRQDVLACAGGALSIALKKQAAQARRAGRNRGERRASGVVLQVAFAQVQQLQHRAGRCDEARQQGADGVPVPRSRLVLSQADSLRVGWPASAVMKSDVCR